MTAVFDCPIDHPARRIAAEAAIDTDGDLILRRVQIADGRTRAFVNDQPVSVQVLRSIGAMLVEIHGQHDDRALVDPVTHRTILDAFGNLQTETRAVADAARRVREARAALNEHRSRIEKARKEADFLRHAVEELTILKPEAGEEAALLAERRLLMMQPEKVASDLNEAFEASPARRRPFRCCPPRCGNSSAAAHRRRASSSPACAPSTPPSSPSTKLVMRSKKRSGRPSSILANWNRRGAPFALRAAARKYDVPADGLAALRDRYESDVAVIDAGEERLAALEQALGEAERAWWRRRKSCRPDAARRPGARQGGAGGAAAPEAGARQVHHGDRNRRREPRWRRLRPGGVLGADQSRHAPGPLLKVASGGELSRFMLALKVVLADKGSAPTLVFDEIDTGVGGAVADAIGQRLARSRSGSRSWP